MAAALRGFRGALLDAIADGPPLYPGQRWFNHDLPELPTDDLREEHRRCRLRLLLTPQTDRDRWPAAWFTERLTRVGDELRRRGVRR